MTDANYQRKRTMGMNLALVFVLTFGLSACSLKWGGDAQRAAAEYESQQRLKQQQAEQAKFADVDSTGDVSDKVSTKASAKSETKPATNSNAASEPRVRYVRIGKERRLAMVVNPNADKNEPPVTDNMPADSMPVSKPKPVDVEHKLSNDKSKASFKNVQSISASTTAVRYPGTQMYGAGLDDSVWVVNSSKLSCELVHPIPRYGRGVFSQRSGNKLQFMVYLNRNHARKLQAGDKRYANPLYTDNYPYPHVGAKLESVPPIWKRRIYKKYLGFMPLTPGKVPFTLPHHKKIPAQLAMADVATTGKSKTSISATETYLPEIWPERLLAELEEGMSLRFTYRDWSDGTQDVVVNISAINYLSVVSDFEKCVQNLKQFNFADYRSTKINYSKNSKGLSKSAKASLDKLAEYLSTNPKVKSINVTAHTDSKGFKRLNRELASKFANKVKAYLQKKGVKVAITTVGAGEGEYLDTNRTAQGRAKNQRIIISLAR